MSVEKKHIAKSARITCLTTLTKAKSPHLGSALSSIDIMVYLYVDHFASSAEKSEKNQLIFSKGHAGIACYSVMKVLGIISSKQLDSYCSDGSYFFGHISHLAHSSIELSTGSLGHGLPFGVGLAYSKKLKRESGTVFVVLSDGEMDEGTTWESALLASKLKLDNLVCIVDRNRLQSLEDTEATLPLDPLDLKWLSFGWNASIINGHDFESLINIKPARNKPSIFIAETVKGKGISWMENEMSWHYKWPDTAQLARAIAELEVEQN